jgi:hypothetical protein
LKIWRWRLPLVSQAGQRVATFLILVSQFP